jgi:hypothetical protein
MCLQQFVQSCRRIFRFRLSRLELNCRQSPPSDTMPSKRPNLILDEQYLQRVLSAAFTIQEDNDGLKLARPVPSERVPTEPEAPSESEDLPSNWAATWLKRQDQGLWSELPAEIRKGIQDSVKPPSRKSKVVRKARETIRNPRARAEKDFADNDSIALPTAENAVEETVAQAKIETIPSRAIDPSPLHQAETESQWMVDATESSIRDVLESEHAELRVEPFPSSTRDDSSPNTAIAGAPAAARTDDERVSAEFFNWVPDHLLVEIVQHALRATRATGAAIALGQEGKRTCRAAAGYSASEIDAMINPRSSLPKACTFHGRMQICGNTRLASEMDADVCHRFGVRAIIVAPLLHQDRSLGLIAVFSRQPYAFGMRDVQVLEDLAERLAAKLQVRMS